MIDVSEFSAVAICRTCHRREVLTDRAEGQTWLARHEAAAHPGQNHNRDALRQATRRRAKSTPGRVAVPSMS